MPMSKSDYVLVARAIRSGIDKAESDYLVILNMPVSAMATAQDALIDLAKRLCVGFKQADDHFSDTKFMRECGIDVPESPKHKQKKEAEYA